MYDEVKKSEQQEPNKIIAQLQDVLMRLPFRDHAVIFREVKEFTKDRMLKEAATRQQENEELNIFIKETLQ